MDYFNTYAHTTFHLSLSSHDYTGDGNAWETASLNSTPISVRFWYRCCLQVSIYDGDDDNNDDDDDSSDGNDDDNDDYDDSDDNNNDGEYLWWWWQ